jgi:hypothetical protein
MVPMVNVRIPLAAPPAALAACLAELVDRMQSMEGARPAERQGRL